MSCRRITIVIRFERDLILCDKQHPLFVTAGTAGHVAAETSSNKHIIHFISMFCKASDRRQQARETKPYIYAGSKNV